MIKVFEVTSAKRCWGNIASEGISGLFETWRLAERHVQSDRSLRWGRWWYIEALPACIIRGEKKALLKVVRRGYDLPMLFDDRPIEDAVLEDALRLIHGDPHWEVVRTDAHWGACTPPLLDGSLLVRAGTTASSGNEDLCATRQLESTIGWNDARWP